MVSATVRCFIIFGARGEKSQKLDFFINYRTKYMHKRFFYVILLE